MKSPWTPPGSLGSSNRGDGFGLQLYESPSHPPVQTQQQIAILDKNIADDEQHQLQQHHSSLADSRYVAGNQFYNHEMYGSLRAGGTVHFYSKECLGLVAAVFSSAFSFQSLQGVLRPLMSSKLNLTKQENVAVQRLIELPMALSFFVGLLSDCYPIMGLRRKAYMIIGMLLNAACVLSMAGISAHFEAQTTKERDPRLVTLVIVMSAFASLGCIITYMCVHTRVIELSQREALRDRGSIQVSYLVFRRLTSLVTASFSYLTLGSGAAGTEPTLLLSNATLLLAVVSLLPLPIILRYWKEEQYSLPVPMKIRGQIFWKIMQQRAVWGILAFISFYALFLAVKFSDSANVVRGWAKGAANDNSLLLKTIQDVIMLLTILAWRVFFMNRSWRAFFCWAPFFQIVPQLLASALVTFDAVRDRYLYRTVMSVSFIGDGITTLNNVAPLVEIIQEGSEGATVGLVLSLQRLIGVFVSTNAQGLFRGDNFYTPADVKLDSASIRLNVFWSLVLNYGINVIALVGLIWLPAQKLDAQQLRMYGGFTKGASAAIILFAAVLFSYSAVINVMSFVPGLSCSQIAGGEGCGSD
ncbi:Transmembrane protein [Globisporangium polare]